MREKLFNLHAQRRDPLTATNQDLDTANEWGLGAAPQDPSAPRPSDTVESRCRTTSVRR